MPQKHTRRRTRRHRRRVRGGDGTPASIPTDYLSSAAQATTNTVSSAVEETKKDLSGLSGYLTKAYNYMTGTQSTTTATTTGGRRRRHGRRTRRHHRK